MQQVKEKEKVKSDVKDKKEENNEELIILKESDKEKEKEIESKKEDCDEKEKEKVIRVNIFEILPDDIIIFQIFLYLKPKEVLELSTINSQIKPLCFDNCLWEIKTKLVFKEERIKPLNIFYQREKEEKNWVLIYKKLLTVSHNCQVDYKMIHKRFEIYRFCQAENEENFLTKNFLMEKEEFLKLKILTVEEFDKKVEIFQKLRYQKKYDGDKLIYEGEMVDGKMQGYGKEWYSDGNKYEGGFYDDKRNGKGSYEWADGNKYVGGFVDDKINGHGEYFCKNGNKYIGQFVNEQRNGVGKYMWIGGDYGGDVYEGEFRDDKINGKGVYTFANGNKYEGMFENEQRNGFGIYYWKDGDRYEGNFIDDKINGYGTYYFGDGNHYKGNFADDRRNGLGVFYWKNGSRYEGNFFDDKKHGKGLFIWKDGSSHEGEYSKGEPVTGILKSKFHGVNYKGDWKLIDKEHSVFDFKGEITEEFTGKKICKGSWKSGKNKKFKDHEAYFFFSGCHVCNQFPIKGELKYKNYSNSTILCDKCYKKEKEKSSFYKIPLSPIEGGGKKKKIKK